MSHNIVSFPQAKEVQELQELKQTLIFCYQQVEDTFECLNEMEESLSVIQETYNQKLVEIAKRGGVERIQIGDLDYATNLHIEASGNGKVKLSLNGVVAGSWEVDVDEE